MDTKSRRPLKRTSSAISWCSSSTGELYISLRSRRNDRRPVRPIDVLAKKLCERHASGRSSLSSHQDNTSWCLHVERPEGRRHLNGCFNQLRFLVAMACGMASGLMCFHRLSISVSILKMVNQTHLYLEEHPNATLQDYLDEGLPEGGEFNWNNEIIAIILGWYMFSYTLPQIPMTRLNTIIGCRFAIPLGLVMSSVASLLTPAAAYWGWQWVVACRFLNGLGAAGIITGTLQLLEDWMRYDEISLGLTLSSLVCMAMIALCPLLAGELAAYHWSLAFTIPSFITLGFCLLWLVLISDEPASNWLISKQELDHLESDNFDQQEQQETQLDQAEIEEAHERVPWHEILKLPSFYAYLIIWALTCSSNAPFLFILPTYLRQTLKTKLADNGLYCFLICLGSLLATVWPHQVMKQVLKMGASVTRARTISQFISSSVLSATFIYVGLFNHLQIPLLILNRCFMTSDLIIIGSVMSNFAKVGLSGTAFAMINTVGNLSITLASPLIGWWLDYTGSSDMAWCVIMCAFGACQLATLLIFVLFIDSEPIDFKRSAEQEPKSATPRGVA